jgi:poly(ADP-ribose) glycohydrolase ARH3
VTPDRQRDKFEGALLGTMVGDALGATVEGTDAGRLRAILDALPLMSAPERELNVALFGLITGYDIPPGAAHYTDDTQMTIGVAESLVAVGDIDEADMARRFVANFQGQRGYGPGAYSVLMALRGGARWDVPAARLFGGSGSYGNGAAMRIAPIGLFFHDADTATLREAAQRSSVITHIHIQGKEGAVMQAAAVAAAFRLDPADEFDASGFLTSVSAHLRDDLDDYLEACDTIRNLLPASALEEEASNLLGSGIEAPRSVPAALYAFLSHYDSFAEAVRFAVCMGDDTDTVGAMCGAIAGAYHGASAIPTNWLTALENGPQGRDYVRQLARDLFDAWQRRH